jgi:malonate-semialdehyde dehydrogenase (acetylating)/methylmalonate-semialdehyde dehydrogenase
MVDEILHHPAIEALRFSISVDDDAHYGPIVSAQHKAKVGGWIQTAIAA